MAKEARVKPVRAPLSVIGHHGCMVQTARSIIEGGTFRHSDNRYDWLGKGVYSWEYAPDRAAAWARGRFGLYK